MTMISHVRQIGKPVSAHSWIHDVLFVIGGSILIAIFAHISIPLPFTPVPLALQPHVCLFLGVLLGSKRAALAVIAFLMQGACGLPVFSQGTSGFAVLLGPRGGYLLGYVIGAFIVGYIWEKAKAKTSGKAFFAMAIGNLVIYCLGVAHLSQYIGITKAVLLGVAPFVIGDVLKLFLTVHALKTAKVILKTEQT